MPSHKIAIVTGGNRGIGHEIARQLLKSDLFVVVGARDQVKCDNALASLRKEGANVAAFPLDVNDTKSVRRFVEHVEKQHGAPSVLVNNAGVYPEATDAKVVDSSTAIWRETFETNLFGAVRMCREVVPLMKKLRYGRIVNISSGLGQLHQMGEGSPAYRVSKAALNALGEDRHGRRGGPAHRGGGRRDRRVAEPPSLERSNRPVLPRPQADPVVSRRTLHLAALVLAALLVASCSFTKLAYMNAAFAYSNATPALTWLVDDYVDLSGAQREFVRERLARAFAWHRADELPEYNRFLESVLRQVEDNLTVEEARSDYRELRERYHRLLDRVLPDAAEFILQLDGEQAAQMERKFAEDNRKMLNEATRGTPAARLERRVKRTLEHLEEFTGALDSAQRELVARHVAAMEDTYRERLADRTYRQNEIVALRAREEKLFGMLSALSASLSAEQRAYFQKRVRGFMRDISGLAAGS